MDTPLAPSATDNIFVSRKAKISVIGAGTMGNGIAHLFAQHRFEVTLVDVNANQLQQAVATIEKNLERQVTKNIISAGDKIAALKNISTATDAAEGVRYADLVVEAATENEALKLNIFKQLDEAAPPAC